MTELESVHGEAIVCRDARQPGRHARYLQLGAPPTRWPAVAGTHGVALGAVTTPSIAELSGWSRVDPRRISRLRLRHWREPSYDIWEEESGLHYYTLRVSAAALEEGADWLDASAARLRQAQSYRAAAQEIRQSAGRLTGCPRRDTIAHGCSRAAQRSTKELDIAVILAAIHALGDGADHTPSAIPVCMRRSSGSSPCSMRPIRSTRNGRRAADRPWGVTPAMSTSRAAPTTSRLWGRPSSAFSRPPGSGRGSLDQAGRWIPGNRSRLHSRRTGSCRNSSTSTPAHKLQRDIWPGATLPSFPAGPPGDLRDRDDNRLTRGLNREETAAPRATRPRSRPAQPGRRWCGPSPRIPRSARPCSFLVVVDHRGRRRRRLWPDPAQSLEQALLRCAVAPRPARLRDPARACSSSLPARCWS